MQTDIDPAGFVHGTTEDVLVAFIDRVLACLEENRRPTPYELAVAFQVGVWCVEASKPYANAAEAVDRLMTNQWADLVEVAHDRARAALPDTGWTEAWDAFSLLFRDLYGEVNDAFRGAAQAGYKATATGLIGGMVNFAGGTG